MDVHIFEKTQDTQGFTLDAGAILSYFRGTDGASLVQRVFRQCQDLGIRAKISPTELFFAYAQVAKERPNLVDDVMAITSQLPIETLSLTQETALRALEILMARPSLSPESALLLAFSTGSKTYLVTERKDLSGEKGVLLLS